jgi:hypothetical protein
MRYCFRRHPKAKRCYGWSYGEPEEFITILELPPVDSVAAAVKTGISFQIKKGKKMNSEDFERNLERQHQTARQLWDAKDCFHKIIEGNLSPAELKRTAADGKIIIECAKAAFKEIETSLSGRSFY